jgi:ABC-2 type transport system ATP-binding protein
MIRIRGLTKKYGGLAAVDSIDLDVASGEIFGFLGPNGAGKTTTIKMLAGQLKPDRGTILIHGNDMAATPLRCKMITGYIPDRPYLYEKLTGLEFLRFIASLYQMDGGLFRRNTEHFLNLFDLISWQHHLIESYSHGMRQKLMIIAAFMIEPPLIIVDEPMVGLDPKSAKIVKELFKNHSRKGGTIFLSTHSLEIAEELCDRIAIIDRGRILALGTLAALRRDAQLTDSGLEDIFLQLTGAFELSHIIAAIRKTE